MPATPANTKLLLHLNNNATDSSDSAHSMTVGSGVSYSAAVYKLGTHSALFDGTSNGFMSAADSNDWSFGSGDFTVEGWFYHTTLPSSTLQTYVSQYDQNTTYPKGWRFYLNHAVTYSLRFQYSTNGTSLAGTLISDTITMAANTWYHMRVCRVSGNYYFFQDGVAKGSGVFSDTIANPAQILVVGASLNATAKNLSLVGYADEVLLVNGTGLSTAGFTPETAEYTANNSLVNGQGVIVQTDPNKHADGALQAQGWTLDGGTSENPASGYAI